MSICTPFCSNPMLLGVQYPNLRQLSLSIPHTMLLIPKIFVVNPASDNIFRQVDYQSAHAAITGLIYCSMWMGALGWDIVLHRSFRHPRHPRDKVVQQLLQPLFNCLHSLPLRQSLMAHHRSHK